MQVGSLVRHVEHGHIGVVVRHGSSSCDRWFIHWNVPNPNNIVASAYFTECELEVLCK